MKSLQQRLTDEFERIALAHDCELVQQPHWANTGQLLAVPLGVSAADFRVVARLHYDIQSGISKVWFNDANQLEPWLNDGKDRSPDVFYFEAHDAARLRSAFARWEQLLTPVKKQPSGDPPGLIAARAQRKAGIR